MHFCSAGYKFVHWPKYVIHFSNLRLVLQIHWCVEVGDLFICAPAHQVSLAGVQKVAELCVMKAGFQDNDGYIQRVYTCTSQAQYWQLISCEDSSPICAPTTNSGGSCSYCWWKFRPPLPPLPRGVKPRPRPLDAIFSRRLVCVLMSSFGKQTKAYSRINGYRIAGLIYINVTKLIHSVSPDSGLQTRLAVRSTQKQLGINSDPIANFVSFFCNAIHSRVLYTQ